METQEFTDECRKCSGTGKCVHCDGTGRVKHECNPRSLKLLAKSDPEWSPTKLYYHRCSVCGRFWKNIYRPDPGAGSSSEWLELDEKSDYRSFTQDELDGVLGNQAAVKE